MLGKHILVIKHHFTQRTSHPHGLAVDLLQMEAEGIFMPERVATQLTHGMLLPFAVDLAIVLIQAPHAFANLVALSAPDTFEWFRLIVCDAQVQVEEGIQFWLDVEFSNQVVPQGQHRLEFLLANHAGQRPF